VSDYPSTPRENWSDAKTDEKTDADDAERSDAGYDVSIVSRGFESIRLMNSTFLFSSEFLSFVVELMPMIRESLGSIENKELKVIAFLLAVGVFVLVPPILQNLF